MEPETIATKPSRSRPEEAEAIENAEQEYITSLWRFATYLANNTVIQDKDEAILDAAIEELGNYIKPPFPSRRVLEPKIVGGEEYPERFEKRYEHSIFDPFSLQGLHDALFHVGMASKVELQKGRLDEFKNRTLNVRNARLQYQAVLDNLLSRQHGMTGEEYKRAIELGMEQKRYLPYALSATDKISKKLHSPREEEIRDVQKEQERFLAFYEAEQKKLQELKDDPEKLQDFIDELDRKYFLQQGAAATAAEYPKKMAAYEEFMKEQTPMEEGVPDKFLELLTSLKDEAEDRIKKAEAEEAAEERKADFRREAARNKELADKLGGRRSTRTTKPPDRFTYNKLGGGIVRGRGLYFPAGENHYIDMNKLDKGFINLKNNKFKQVGKMEVAGGTLCSAVKSVLKGQNPRAEDVDELNDRERGYLNKLAKVTGEGNFHVPVKNLSEEEKEQHEFDVMKGEIIAGNDNEKLVKDFKRLLLKLMSKHKINKKEGHDILMELVILGY